ncbi:hypothetical protein ACFVN4_03055 [Streptomyces rochei]|uniref:hypothetical protein n=1 Tax=Streptomyces rochei TaxID=1928 RepID=UPI0036AA8B86
MPDPAAPAPVLARISSDAASLHQALHFLPAELTAALARAVENQRRQAAATSRRVVLIGPTPQQFIESATDLVDRIPALCDAVSRDRPQSPCR